MNSNKIKSVLVIWIVFLISFEATSITNKRHASVRNGLVLSLGSGGMYSGSIGASGYYAFRSGSRVWSPVLTIGFDGSRIEDIGYSAGIQFSQGFVHQPGLLISAGTVGWENIIRPSSYWNTVQLEFETNRLYGISVLPNYTYSSKFGIIGIGGIGFSIAFNMKEDSNVMLGPILSLGIGYKL